MYSAHTYMNAHIQTPFLHLSSHNTFNNFTTFNTLIDTFFTGVWVFFHQLDDPNLFNYMKMYQ